MSKKVIVLSIAVTVVIGGRLDLFESNAKLGQGKFLGAEADESGGSFLKLSPTIAVVTSIDADHLDYYHDLDEIKATFIDFINKVPFYGLAVLCLDDPNLQGLIPQVKKRFITYGLANQADFYATAIEHNADRTAFTVHYRGETLGLLGFRMPGRHNVLNALAAVAVGMELGLDFPAIAAGFKDFGAEWGGASRSRGKGQFYDQGYVDDLVAGNLSASIAWSGDVLYNAIWEDYPFEFVVPEGGAMLWIDNMLIPVNAENPAGAYQMMDFYYKPEIAQLVTEWVLYMSPVPAVQELIAAHAGEVKDEAYAEDLTLTAESPLLWPDDELLGRVSLGRNLVTQEERGGWAAIFLPISEGA